VNAVAAEKDTVNFAGMALIPRRHLLGPIAAPSPTYNHRTLFQKHKRQTAGLSAAHFGFLHTPWGDDGRSRELTSGLTRLYIYHS